MKTNLIALVCLVMALAGCKEGKQTETKSTDVSAKIKTLNHYTEQQFQNKNIDSIVGLYATTFTYMPEYKTAIFSKDKLREFCREWLRTTDIDSYKKTIYELKIIAGHVFEIGTFQMNYHQESDSTKTYQGKYMTLWKDNGENASPEIISEIFGSDSYITPEEVPYSKVNIIDSTARKPTVDDSLKEEILKINAEVIKTVEEGDAESRAKGFFQDGICMPRHKEMLIGMDKIRPYMQSIYNPEASLYVAHSYYDIYSFNEYVLVNGHFKGGWGDSINHQTFEGNMSNLRKRNEQGELLMYWQLASGDR